MQSGDSASRTEDVLRVFIESGLPKDMMCEAMKFADRFGTIALEDFYLNGHAKANEALEELREFSAALQEKLAKPGDSSIKTIWDTMAPEQKAAFFFTDTTKYKHAKRYITLMSRTLAMSEYGGYDLGVSFNDEAQIIEGWGVLFQAHLEETGGWTKRDVMLCDRYKTRAVSALGGIVESGLPEDAMRIAMQFALHVGLAVLEDVCFEAEGPEKATNALREGSALLQASDGAIAASTTGSATTVRNVMAYSATTTSIFLRDALEHRGLL